MLGWLHKWLDFGKPKPPPPRFFTVPAPVPLPHLPDATGSMEAYLAVLKKDASLAEEPDWVEPSPEDLQLADLVYNHFKLNRPGPSMAPRQALQIITLVANPDVEVRELVRVIQADAALTAGVIRAANCAALVGVQPVESVKEAVTRLGLVDVARVAGALSAKSLFSPRSRAEHATFEPLWHQLFHSSAAQGMACAGLAMRLVGSKSDHVFLGGMLHDIGKVVALRSLTALMLEDMVPKNLDPLRAANVLEMVHEQVGVLVHAEWELPEYLQGMCERHHAVDLPSGGSTVDLHVVRLVSALDDLEHEAPWQSRAVTEAWSSAQALKLSPPAVRALRTDFTLMQKKTASMFAA